jgi:hypothetical protein
MLLKIKTEYENSQEYLRELLIESENTNMNISEQITFAKIIWSKYGKSKRTGERWDYMKCPRCECRPCNCPRYLRIPWGKLVFEKNLLSGMHN